MKTQLIRFAILVLGAAACAAPVKIDKPRDEMSERERDSTIAGSGLPGSGVVKKAMSMSDVQQIQSAELDSASREN